MHWSSWQSALVFLEKICSLLGAGLLLHCGCRVLQYGGSRLLYGSRSRCIGRASASRIPASSYRRVHCRTQHGRCRCENCHNRGPWSRAHLALAYPLGRKDCIRNSEPLCRAPFRSGPAVPFQRGGPTNEFTMMVGNSGRVRNRARAQTRSTCCVMNDLA